MEGAESKEAVFASAAKRVALYTTSLRGHAELACCSARRPPFGAAGAWKVRVRSYRSWAASTLTVSERGTAAAFGPWLGPLTPPYA